MEANPHNVPNNVAYPLAEAFINDNGTWCRHLPQGVRDALINCDRERQAEETRLTARGTGLAPGRMRDRLIGQRRDACTAQQREIIEAYIPVANNWRDRNNNWEQLRNQLLNNHDLNLAIRDFNDGLLPNQGPQQAGIRIGHINLCSLITQDEHTGHADKFENLRIILGVFNFDIFVVGESKVKGIDDGLLAINGYAMVRLDRSYPGHAYNDGGLLVYIRNNLNYIIRNRQNRNREGDPDNSLLQLIDLEVVRPHLPNVRVVAVYNPPWGGHVQAMRRLLNDYRNVDPNIIILGDINIDILGNINQEFQDYFWNNPRSFRQCINAVTRPESNTLIDHIYTRRANFNQLILESGVVQIDGFADHELIFCTIPRN